MKNFSIADIKSGERLFEATGEVRVPRRDEFYSIGIRNELERQGETFFTNLPMRIYRPAHRIYS